MRKLLLIYEALVKLLIIIEPASKLLFLIGTNLNNVTKATHGPVFMSRLLTTLMINLWTRDFCK